MDGCYGYGCCPMRPANCTTTVQFPYGGRTLWTVFYRQIWPCMAIYGWQGQHPLSFAVTQLHETKCSTVIPWKVEASLESHSWWVRLYFWGPAPLFCWCQEPHLHLFYLQYIHMISNLQDNMRGWCDTHFRCAYIDMIILSQLTCAQP